MSQYQHFKLENININLIIIIENISINLRKREKKLIAAVGLAYPMSMAKLRQQPRC
jgi:hypothetical protein